MGTLKVKSSRFSHRLKASVNRFEFSIVIKNLQNRHQPSAIFVCSLRGQIPKPATLEITSVIIRKSKAQLTQRNCATPILLRNVTRKSHGKIPNVRIFAPFLFGPLMTMYDLQ